ncbi:hypothetical protein ACLH17_27275 [Klebsiella pasteurii]|uniref:hypothetical protein n=1 Tax=Klebsiella TaxID=570 RepID=UPI0032B39FDF
MKKILLALFFVGCFVVSSTMYYYLYIQIKESDELPERQGVVDEKVDNSDYFFYVLSVRDGYLL